jgi:hypothetical protein
LSPAAIENRIRRKEEMGGDVVEHALPDEEYVW